MNNVGRKAALLAWGMLIPSGAAQEKTSPPSPLFRFAWITDMHLDERREEIVAGGLRAADELRPHFVLITGDNNARPAPEDPNRPEPLPLRRQRFLKDFLGRHLRAPAVIIPGDNWPGDFEKVFGAFQYSFDFGGVHFLLLAPDRRASGPGIEGLSVFDPPTWDWIRKDLEGNRAKPVLAALHEPVYPPAFLDAPPLRRLLARFPNVIAVLQGHLHVEAAWVADGKTYLVGPSLGAAPVPRFKLAEVHRDRIVFGTLFRAAGEDSFRRAEGERTVEIPPLLREGLGEPRGPFAMGNRDSVPAHPVVEDPSLIGRRGELVRILREFLWGRPPTGEKGP